MTSELKGFNANQGTSQLSTIVNYRTFLGHTKTDTNDPRNTFN